MPPLSPLAHAARGDPNWIKLLKVVRMERKMQINWFLWGGRGNYFVVL